jgi:hypothetical protein
VGRLCVRQLSVPCDIHNTVNNSTWTSKVDGQTGVCERERTREREREKKIFQKKFLNRLTYTAAPIFPSMRGAYSSDRSCCTRTTELPPYTVTTGVDFKSIISRPAEYQRNSKHVRHSVSYTLTALHNVRLFLVTGIVSFFFYV